MPILISWLNTQNKIGFRSALDVKKARNLVFTWVSGLSWIAFDQILVVIGGLEPPTPAL
jgi:hypothetical protein